MKGYVNHHMHNTLINWKFSAVEERPIFPKVVCPADTWSQYDSPSQ